MANSRAAGDMDQAQIDDSLRASGRFPRFPHGRVESIEQHIERRVHASLW
jgi:hypothetical protein